jgi:hypothetical protein
LRIVEQESKSLIKVERGVSRVKEEKRKGTRAEGGNAAFFKGGKHGALFESGTIKHGVCQRRMVQEGRALLALSWASGSRRAD